MLKSDVPAQQACWAALSLRYLSLKKADFVISQCLQMRVFLWAS